MVKILQTCTLEICTLFWQRVSLRLLSPQIWITLYKVGDSPFFILNKQLNNQQTFSKSKLSTLLQWGCCCIERAFSLSLVHHYKNVTLMAFNDKTLGVFPFFGSVTHSLAIFLQCLSNVWPYNKLSHKTLLYTRKEYKMPYNLTHLTISFIAPKVTDMEKVVKLRNVLFWELVQFHINSIFFAYVLIVQVVYVKF